MFSGMQPRFISGAKNSMESYSVIIPFYNGNTYFEACLASIADQGVIPDEVIVIVDHGSVDPLVFKDYPFALRIIPNTNEHRGAGVCRYIGVQNARTDIIAFLDCDDIWLPNKMAKQLQEFENSDVNFLYSGFAHLYSNENTKAVINRKSEYLTESSLVKKLQIVGCLTVVARKSLFSKIPEPSLFKRNDYQMWAYVMRENKNFVARYTDCILALHRVHSSSLTSSKLSSFIHYYLFLRAMGYTVSRSIVVMVHYSINTLNSRFG